MKQPASSKPTTSAAKTPAAAKPARVEQPSAPETGRGRVSAVSAARKKPEKPSRTRALAPVRVAFSFEEALEVARSNTSKPTAGAAASIAVAPVASPVASPAAPAPATPTGKRKVEVTAPPKTEARVLRAASLADILGFDPTAGQSSADEEAAKVPEKWQRYYKLLVELRTHIKDGLTLHSEETLMKSAKDDAGDLSGYSQHMADSGTDTFDRDFALSVVANEQEALNEIEAAIKRIHNGTYGICEVTGKPLSKERLTAVPFARYSVESQTEMEKMKRQRAARSSALAEFEDEEGGTTPAAGGGDEDAAED